MDTSDWDYILQYVTDPLDVDHLDAPMNNDFYPTPEMPFAGESPDESSQESVDGTTLVSVSTTFYPGADVSTSPSDLIVLSSDSVFFHVHSQVLGSASTNHFNSTLPDVLATSYGNQVPILIVPESSVVVNIIFHTLYDIPGNKYSPSFEATCDAVNSLIVYGVPLSNVINPNQPLFQLLLSHAPQHPLELYTLAARHDLHTLAVPTSSHLLSLTLSSLTDEDVDSMGPRYLRRLFFLHLGRIDALKRSLLPPPRLHGPTSHCDFAAQKDLTRAWALATSYLAWDAKPVSDMSTSTLESSLAPLGDHVSCSLCQDELRARINNLIVQWALVKVGV
ncbi:hypothetical protein PLICRDRAFT_114133 [Plicaturopsis crispa FD-325 SS-3]|nr:hypothetical protein PLICRDRAFT_114133 [Plicaturopsis crispa FD-325 SS-3]